jgi:transcriptional regulator with XRE-family HTH domain
MTNPADNSRQPFGRALHELRSARGWTFRRLAEETEKSATPSEGLSFAYLAKLERGAVDPTPAAMELLADVLCEGRAEYFAEYRLHQARTLLDERDAGLEEALERLDRVRAAIAA